MTTTSPQTAPLILGLTKFDLTTAREKSYGFWVLLFSILVWVVLVISMIGIVYGALFGLMAWLGSGLLAAYLRSEAVQVDEQQLPELHAEFVRACDRLGVTRVPRLYVLQAGGTLNAFATRFSGRDFVVVYSDMLEAFGPSSPEIRFILGHELGHIKSNHISKRVLMLPGVFLPLLGTAYLRACESSCDRHGAFVAGEIDGSVRAMMTLSGGKAYGRTLDAKTFANQYYHERGFFVSWHELTSGYPTLSHRVVALLALGDPHYARKATRNPFAYFFALVTPGGQMSAAPNLMIFVVVIGLLAAMAIPAFNKVRETSLEKVCINNRRLISLAVTQFMMEKGRAPQSYDEIAGPGKLLKVMPSCPSHVEYSVTTTPDGNCEVKCSVHTRDSVPSAGGY